MNVKMLLVSDAIFGNGTSIPGEEDVSILCDDQGFPYYKAGTWKGLFREQLERLLQWKSVPEDEISATLQALLGESGDENNDARKLRFSDLALSDCVKSAVLDQTGDDPEMIRRIFSNMRTFTKLTEEGLAKEHTLRVARCVNKGLAFHGSILCLDQDRNLVTETLSMMKFIGTMRNRGFGKVEFSEEGK